MRKYKNDLIKLSLLTLLNVGLIAIFLGVFYLANPSLGRLSRTLVITTLSFLVTFQFTSKIYDGFQIGEEKSKPIIYSMGMAVVFASIVTYLALMIMNTNPNNLEANAAFKLEDIDKLFIAMILQLVYLSGLTYLGNFIYFKCNRPRRVLVVNNDYASVRNVLQHLKKYRKQYLEPVVINEINCDEIAKFSEYDIFVLLNTSQETINRVIEYGFRYNRDVFFNAEFNNVMVPTATTYFSDILMCKFVNRPLSFGGAIIKRLIDIVVSLIGIILTSPIMIVVAILIKLEDKGPVFFRQDRITKDGRIFQVYKFRSMKMNAGDKPASEKDDRITKTGEIIRRLRIDELPQFFNILLNDMSVVGPRPESRAWMEQILKEVPEFKYRLKVKGGLTGQAQIYGKYNTNPAQKLILDIDYIENQSVWNDIKLIFLTLTVFFKKDSTEGFTEDEKEIN